MTQFHLESTAKQIGLPIGQLQKYIREGQLAGLSIGQIIQIIVTYGVPILEQILSMMAASPTLSIIEAILAVIGGLIPPPTPVPPIPPKPPIPPSPIPNTP